MATFKPEEVRALEEGGNGVQLTCLHLVLLIAQINGFNAILYFGLV